MRTDYENTPNLKKHRVKDFPTHTNKDVVLKRINELKSNKIFSSMRSETDDGLSSSANFQVRLLSYEFESNKPVLQEIESLRVKIGVGELELLRAVSNRNSDVL